MLHDRIEERWIAAFATLLGLGKPGPGELACRQGESRSRARLTAWDGRAAHAVCHLEWGLKERARCEARRMDDRRTNGTELRASAGAFPFSTGTDEFAGRYTEGRLGILLRHCPITLDGGPAVPEEGLAA